MVYNKIKKIEGEKVMKFTKNEILLMIYLVLQLVQVFFKLSDNYEFKLESILQKLENEVQKDE